MTVGIVCARAGSVGCPHKNIRTINGERLIERAVRLAYDAGCDDVVVSTDYRPNVDYDTLGAQHVDRPDRLRGADVSKWPVYHHAVRAWEGHKGQHADVVVDIDVSRPLRTADTIRRTVDAVTIDGAAMAVARSDKHPAFDLLDGPLCDLSSCETVTVTARQQLDPVWVHAGVYAMTRAALFDRDHFMDGPVVGIECDRIEALDVDDELDWRIVEYLGTYPPLAVRGVA